MAWYWIVLIVLGVLFAVVAMFPWNEPSKPWRWGREGEFDANHR